MYTVQQKTQITFLNRNPKGLYDVRCRTCGMRQEGLRGSVARKFLQNHNGHSTEIKVRSLQ